MGALASVALGLHGSVKLFGECQARQGKIHAARFGQGNAHVLEEVLDEEARLEIASDHAGAPGS